MKKICIFEVRFGCRLSPAIGALSSSSEAAAEGEKAESEKRQQKQPRKEKATLLSSPRCKKTAPPAFLAYHPLPSFMEGKGPEPSVGGSKKHPKRAFFHDYCSPGYYLITATTLPGSPRLSEYPGP